MTDYLVSVGTLGVCYFYVALLWLMLAVMNMIFISVRTAQSFLQNSSHNHAKHSLCCLLTFVL